MKMLSLVILLLCSSPIFSSAMEETKIAATLTKQQISVVVGQVLRAFKDACDEKGYLKLPKSAYDKRDVPETNIFKGRGNYDIYFCFKKRDSKSF